MNFKFLIWIFGCLLILELQQNVACDYSSLLTCGEHRNCWPHLDNAVVTAIRYNIKNESSPCDNFWYYACGEWQSPREQHYSDNFAYIMEKYAKRVEEFLLNESELTKTSDVKGLINKLSNYYQSCMSIALKYAEPKHYLAELPKPQTLEWPNWRDIIESNNTMSFNWLQALAKLRLYGLNGVFIEERATVAFNDSTKNVIEIKTPDEFDGFEKKFELVNYFVEFGLVDGVTDRIWDLAAEIFELDHQLKELRKKHDNDDDATFEEALNLTQLKERVPSIDWQNYLNILLGQAHVSGSTPIEVNGIAYLKELAALLGQNDERIIALYVLLQLCKYILNIRPQINNRHCLDHMSTLMPLGLNYVYDRFIYETRQNDEQALELILGQLKQQFRRYLNLNKLHLDQTQKDYLQNKLNKMELRLGNLSKNASSEYYESYYSAVNITSNFYKNHWEMLRFRTTQQHIGFINHIEHIDLENFYVYDDISQMRNAPYFVHERNLLIVPMIFMQLPFFHHNLQPLLQYSLVGFILGHEFNHAFENDGVIMDADGNESKIGFAIKQKREFISNVECFQKTQTASLVERMADVNGFQLAYDAYFANEIENSAENTVDNSDILEDFTERQLFFLNFAQFFCGDLPIAIDHDADDVRVNEIVKNMPEFREVFHCNVEKLVQKRADICEMWRS